MYRASTSFRLRRDGLSYFQAHREFEEGEGVQMKVIEQSHLWQRSLADQGKQDKYAAPRKYLREAFVALRHQAETLAGEIPQDVKALTVHSIEHIDTLWKIADVVAGRDYDVTPTEAFVLGGAFLLHDLGLALAAYPRGLEELKELDKWRDEVVRLLRKKNDRAPTRHEMRHAGADIEQATKEHVVRLLHAERAAELATLGFQHRSRDACYYLIEKADIRERYGTLIGQIAYSHWWPVSKVASEFSKKLGPPHDCPTDWDIDPLKVACLLRAADACHLDAGRAPGFLRALRKPAGLAEVHWRFQEYLNTPRVEDHRIEFTSSRPFVKDDVEPWWLCFDTLCSVDRELRDIDSLFRETHREPLQAQGVAGIEDSRRLTKYIPTKDWVPVDTRVRVNDVASLVGRFGGAELFGRDPAIPLRELIQNARDAIRARRIREDRAEDWGEIAVRLGRDSRGEWIEFKDTGKGMSEECLVGPLLDFGTSYWNSDLMIRENPGLMGSGFEPTGKYGIGFFSAFIWGKRVLVVTRRPEDRKKDTRVLEFEQGADSRPILRPASEGEQLREAGTTVRVWLERRAIEQGGVLGPEPLDEFFEDWSRSNTRRRSNSWSLSQLCEYLCPALDVDLYVDEDGQRAQVIKASDWIHMEGRDLLQRICIEGANQWGAYVPPDQLDAVGKTLGEMNDDEGNIVGRACITPNPSGHPGLFKSGLVTAGPFRSSNLGGICGVVLGRSIRATRDKAEPIADKQSWARWATEQSDLVMQLTDDPSELHRYAAIVRSCGGDTKRLPIAQSARGWLSFDQIACWNDMPDEVNLLHFETPSPNGYPEIPEIPQNVLVVDASRYTLDGSVHSEFSSNPEKYWKAKSSTLFAAAVEAISRAWGSSIETLIAAMRRVGHDSMTGGIDLSGMVLRKP